MPNKERQAETEVQQSNAVEVPTSNPTCCNTNVGGSFSVKYPRTFHFEFSQGQTNDDKIQYDLSNFEGKEIVITEKMDGENTTMTNEKYYARSLDSNNHSTRNYVKGIWGKIKHEIPNEFRICGENLFAKHSIAYQNLADYFLCFSIWQNDMCLSWNETLEYCELLNLKTVPVLWKGKFDLNFINNFSVNTEIQEGFVVRLADNFLLQDFNKSVVKWVRLNHVETDEHWMSSKIIPNKLKSV